MLRVREQTSPGWRTILPNEFSAAIGHQLYAYCGNLHNVSILLSSESTTFENVVLDKDHGEMRTKFIFHRQKRGHCAQQRHEVENTDIFCKTGACYSCQSFLLRHYEVDPFCELWHKDATVLKPCFATVLSKISHMSMVSFRVLVERFGKRNIITFDCQKMYPSRLFILSAHVHSDAISIQIQSNFLNPKFQQYTDYEVTCVNACYTTTVHGKIQSNAETEQFRINRGSCGVQFCFQSILGTVNLYRTEGNLTKVTCKAFALRQGVCEAIQRVCMIMGMMPSAEIFMHMLVLNAKTGSFIDIEEHGYFHHYLKENFAETSFVFTPCIEELNIHATVKWTGLNALRKLLQSDAEKQIPEPLAENLDQIDLTITVTRFGTIIYRISTSKKTRGVEDFAYLPEHETIILFIVNKLHRLISTWKFLR